MPLFSIIISWWYSLVGVLFKRRQGRSNKIKIRASVVIRKKSILKFTDFKASILDHVHELLGKGVSLQLVSSTNGDPNKLGRGMVGEAAWLEEWTSFTLVSLRARETKLCVTFDWEEENGVPGAVIVKNHHHAEFYLKSLTLEDFPGKGRIHFECNSWVYPVKCYKYDRVFFTNHTYIPSKTPETLQQFRKEELLHLRGDHVIGQLREHDRVYGYAFYNDLGQPEKGPDHARPVLGGSKAYPYPRRGRTSRRPNHTDPKTESRLFLMRLDIYVPRDERFNHFKLSDFLGHAFKSTVQSLLPLLNTIIDVTAFEFDSFQDVLSLYEGDLALPNNAETQDIRSRIPFEMIKNLVCVVGQRLHKHPVPQVIQEDKDAWRTDEEFAREMLAGVNPVLISRLKEFPPVSKLDPSIYGDHRSTISASHIEPNLEGYTVDQALSNNKLFILDHHDMLIPYLNRINNDSSNKIYASRTLLFLRDDNTLKPLVIELSLPHPRGEEHGAISQVFTPSEHGVDASIWQLAKAYVAVNDSGVHQLICHWLNTHAVMEPFVIATNRQLSVMHPIHKLLSPHFRDTMNINALARQTLINAGGILEYTVFPGKYAMEMSAIVYKSWKFTEQALPVELIKRGVAVKDTTQPNNIRLLIEDYPYAVDGLAIWSAIQTWVDEYCSIYYPNDAAVTSDEELQAWWTEVREVGHGDKKDEPWWPAMHSLSDLTQTCTTIIWIASALHAAVNFGQYPYAGYLPNRPTISRQFMPEIDSDEYEELKRDPERVFLKTITSQLQTIVGVSLIEVLSKHSSEEVYLGQRDSNEWTADEEALEAFRRFGDRLVEIEDRIVEMNKDDSLKNRTGPVKMPYTFLYPNTSEYRKVAGLVGKGVPNSISI